jgi:hypothetical protein
MSGVGITGKIVPLNGGLFSVYDGQPVASLAVLATMADFSTGSRVFVIDQDEYYQLDKTNAFTAFSPLIIAAAGGGRWFRRSKAYVVGNFTLWCNSYGRGIVGFTPGQLQASAATEPEIVLTFSGLGFSGTQSIVTDALGNLWICNVTSAFTVQTMRKFLLKDCLKSGAVTPAVTLNVPITATFAESEGGSPLFDRNGGLWIGNGSHGTFGVTGFARFGPKAYSQSNGVPGLTLSADATPPTSNLRDSVFDGEGNLWSSYAVNAGPSVGGILMYTPAQQQAGGANISPTVKWEGTNINGTGLACTNCMAVSPTGKLYVCNFGVDNNIRAWTLKGATSGNPAPSIVLSSSAFAQPYWITFDSSGNLWVQSGTVNKLMRIPAAQTLATGTVTPDIIITTSANDMTSTMTFPNNPDRCAQIPAGMP